MKRIIISISLFQFAFASLASAATIYVDDSAPPSGANNGTSWADAYIDLHDGLKAAQPGDEVRIGQGTYKPAEPDGDPAVSFELPNGAVVQGGYAGFGAANPDALDSDDFETILSGDLNGNDGKPGSWVGYEENSYHVVKVENAGAGTELRGVTVRSGITTDVQEADGQGGGILLLNSALTIHECTIEDNGAFINGGGIGAFAGDGSSSITATECVIRRNRTFHHVTSGGGVACQNSSFTDCIFEDNRTPTAASGAAISGSSLIIESCLFNSNVAAEDGGAIIGSNLTISNTHFIGNGAGVFGGTLDVGGTNSISDCTFQSSSCNDGGAILVHNGQTTVADTAFDGNQATSGGAVTVFEPGSASFVRVTFAGNRTFVSNGANGGAVKNHGNLELVNCVFQNNNAELWGGAISNDGVLSAVNCRFSDNFTHDQGGALFNSGEATMINCTVADNLTRIGTTTNDSGALHNEPDGQLTVNNCIVWANETANGLRGETAQIWNEPAGTLSVNNSCIEGWTGAYGGVGNSGIDPQMVNENDNFRLTENSPCIDQGDNAWLPSDEHDVDEDGDTAETIPLDLDLHARIANGTVDAGAYEFQGAPAGCAADIAPNGGNGTVDTDDLLVVINNWSGSGPEGDVTGDDMVDVDDLLAVINSWGPCE